MRAARAMAMDPASCVLVVVPASADAMAWPPDSGAFRTSRSELRRQGRREPGERQLPMSPSIPERSRSIWSRATSTRRCACSVTAGEPLMIQGFALDHASRGSQVCAEQSGDRTLLLRDFITAGSDIVRSASGGRTPDAAVCASRDAKACGRASSTPTEAACASTYRAHPQIGDDASRRVVRADAQPLRVSAARPMYPASPSSTQTRKRKVHEGADLRRYGIHRLAPSSTASTCRRT